MSDQSRPGLGIAELQERLRQSVATAQHAAAPGHRPTDVLLAALCEIAGHYGIEASPDALAHGLPLSAGRMPLEHIGLAASRAGLLAEIADGDVSRLDDAALPVIVLTTDGEARVLWSIERSAAGEPVAATVHMPGDARDCQRESFADFAGMASGRIIPIRPAASSSAVGPDAGTAPRLDWFLPPFLTSRGIYREAILATIAINVLALAMPLFTMNVYDRVLPNAAADTLWALSIGVLIATGFDFAIKVLRAGLVDVAGQRADVVLANFIFGRVLGARLTSVQSSSGIRANTLREFETLREFFNSAALTTFGDLPFLLLFLAMIAVVAGPLVLVPLAMIPLVFAVAWATQRRIARLTESQFRETAFKNAVAVESLAGLETIKAAGAESWAASKWERAVASNIRTGNAIRHQSTVGLNLLFALQTAVQIVMIIVGFYMVAAGAITTGALIAATMLAGRAMQPLGQAGALIARLNQARMAYRMLDQMVQAPQERAAETRMLAPRQIEGAIELDQVTFGYDKDAPPAVRDVTLSIQPGERVAIVGGIGSGKSTLLKLIHALHVPTSGRVLLDGLPVSHIDPAILRKHVGLAMQGADLFQGTLRENIVLGDLATPQDAVVRAARQAGALDWISRLPKGLDTPIQERGAGLSGGQKQTLVLARALARDPRIVLLDEPTSDMDTATENEIVRRLSAGLKDRTVIVVTHRPALLDLVDRIIVLDGGRKIIDAPKASALASMGVIAARAAAASKAASAKAGVP